MRHIRSVQAMVLPICAACCLLLCPPQHEAVSAPAGGLDSTAAGLMLDLLSAAESAEAAAALDSDRLLRAGALMDSSSPAWPAMCFLLGEVHRLRGETETAYHLYEALAASGLEDGDGRSLAALSLLRMGQMLRKSDVPDSQKASRIIDLSRPILADGPPGVFDLPVLGNAARVKEALLEEVALLAWSAGDRLAGGLIFMKYLEVAQEVNLRGDLTEIADYLVSSGRASQGGLALIRGKCFYGSRKLEDARDFLREASKALTPEVRAEAAYYLARTRSMQGAPRREIIDLLTTAIEETTDPGLTQEILFYRASVFNREGGGRDTERFLADLNEIIGRFPMGGTADDAIHEIARYHEAEGNTAEALNFLARLRSHAGPNDWVGSSHFRAAMILYASGGQEDIEEAARLLRDLIAVSPAGQFSLAARFWLGRMEEERGDTTSARFHFKHIIETCPYDYYGVRARIHINAGHRAAMMVRPDAASAVELADAYRAAVAGTLPPEDRPQENRLPPALAGGIYARLLSVEGRLRARFPSKHFKDLTVADLDTSGTFAAVGLLFAMRETAIAEATRSSDARNRLSVAFSAGQAGGDWPLALLLVFGLDRSIEIQAVIQHDPSYLKTAYPPLYIEPIAGAAEANGLPPELLYAVIRRESLFCPTALSKRGAMGLFQFMPSTFGTLDSRWNLLGRSGKRSMEAFLYDPGSAIDLGARWFAEELLKRNDGNILLAVMEHNAGYPAVKAWREAWAVMGRSDDIEYMTETARFAETRIFARSVLTDMALAAAADLFGAHGTAPSRK